MRQKIVALCFSMWVFTGCLDPLVDDAYEQQDDGMILPEGTYVPSLHDDPVLDEQVDANDGVERLVPLINGFSASGPIRYWDFGTAPDFTAPVWVFGRDDGEGGFTFLPNHLPLFDVVPGDAAYTPFWQAHMVIVTDAYNGELITSPVAIEEAVERGLVEEPVPLPMYVNCPVVHPDVRVEVGGGNDPIAPGECYYKGMRCYYYDIAPPLVTEEPLGEAFPSQNVFQLRREGDEPLSEPQRNVDMTGDDDIVDTNDIFEIHPTVAGYIPLSRVVRVAVSAETGSIDTYQDETQADFTNASQLFDGTGNDLSPVGGNVIAYEVTEDLHNLPIQLNEGGIQ